MSAVRLSTRNFTYIQTFASAWPDPAITQQAVAQIPWGQNVALLDKLHDVETRHWYAHERKS
jgi:hypothetical protein